ncbi:PglL family O-oligosaccharyltransferase [Alteromonas sp. a30]|uniref:PglL family O-oligosaccharyltransferase n=1 Tax=Alteromonas sp. a30 TaxID=2730917 RepID=UPI0022814D63|nr:Wzy polymerase domain-containing protein [Alteromonas sp. a30]MCY7295268.1 hypothetical protein [Alteromonas sp. a30]
MHQFFHRFLRRLHLPVFWFPICLYFLFGLQYFQANMGGAGTDLPINLVGWICIGLTLSIGLWQLNQRKKLKINRQLLAIGLCFLTLYIPFLYGNSAPQASTWYRFLAIPLLFALTLLSLQYRLTRRSQNTIIGVIFLSSCAQLSIAIYQLLSPQHAFEPFGHFQQTNLMGSYLVTGYACLIYLISQLSLNTKHWFRWIMPNLLIVAFLMGFMTLELHSRGTQLSALLVSLLALIFSFRQKKPMVFIAVISFFIGLMAQFSLHNAKEQQNNSAALLAPYQQDYDREILYPQTLELIKNNFFTGVGYGNFESAYTLLSVNSAAKANTPDDIRYNMDHPHNEGLFWFAEGGVLAGLSVLTLLSLLIYGLTRQQRHSAWLAWSLIIPIGTHSLTEYPLHASVAHLLVMLTFIRLFILKQTPDKTYTIPDSVSVLLRPISLIITLIITAFGVTGLHTISLVLEYELSGGRSPEPYLKIINPLVHYDRYWSNIMAHKAIAAANTNDREGMLEYIRWAQKEIKHHPKQIYFENSIRLKHHLGILENADCAQYELYFPKKKCAELTH